MISLQEFCEALDTLLGVKDFEDYGPNGLQVEGTQELRRVATAVSASMETIEAAIEWGADALVAHHGLFWKRDSYCITGVKRKKIESLLSNGISLLGYHLPLDAHQELGNNWRAALDLGWTKLQAFGPPMGGSSIGVRGEIQVTDVEIFREKLEAYYEHPAYCALGGPDKLQSVALISGGAHWNIKDAVKEGVDAFITGSFDEPIWHIAKEEGIHFFAMGHSASERVGPRALSKAIQERMGLETVFLDLPNPF